MPNSRLHNIYKLLKDYIRERVNKLTIKKFKLRLLCILGTKLSDNKCKKKKQKIVGSYKIITIYEQRDKIHPQLQVNYPYKMITHLLKPKSKLQHFLDSKA